MSRDGHTDHIARHESAGLIHMAEKTDIVLDIVDDNRLSGSSDVSCNTLPMPETNLANSLALLAMDHIKIQFARGFLQQEKRAGFGIHQERGRFDGALADGHVIETGIQQGADFLKLSQCGVFHNLESCMRRCAEYFCETVSR